jgi:DNA invertase Pin-like site-specific DNA recombinase
MRVLGVARVSTQEQAHGDRFSIPHQREQITQYCLQRRWELIDVVESVHSGGSNYRELQHILERVRHDHIQVVVVNELDRLARDMVSTLLFLEDLQKVGCRFASVADEMDLTTPDGELKMMILSVFAHYFRKQLARKVKGGLAERARQGKHHGGRPPYGFVFAGDHLAPHPEQASQVPMAVRSRVSHALSTVFDPSSFTVVLENVGNSPP